MAKPTYGRTPGQGRQRPAERTETTQSFQKTATPPQRTLPVRPVVNRTPGTIVRKVPGNSGS